MVQSTDWRDQISCTTSRPAQSRYAAALCTDANYLPYALFVANELHELHDMESLDIVMCVTDDCVIPDSLGHLNLRVCRISAGAAFAGLYLDARRTEAVYHRLAIPYLFRTDYDRILYLDSDIFIQGSAFARLFSIDMGGRAIAAVRDVPQWTKPTKELHPFAEKRRIAPKYFNSGVMLIDTVAFQSTGILERCLALGNEFLGKSYQHDQDLINCALEGDWVELSPMWNWQRAVGMPHNGTMLPLNIVHFIGARKPWRDWDFRIAPRFKFALNAFLRRNFPELPGCEIISAGKTSRLNYVQYGLDLIKRSRAMARYVARFPDDLVARD